MNHVIAEGKRKATKQPHTCFMCDAKIPVGSTCHWQTNDGFGYGNFATIYWHDGCDDSFHNRYSKATK